MKISCIVAMTPERLIGINNQIPWHLPADLQFFKKITTGHHILMGRKCFESIGKPLANRTNIVISRDKDLYISQCTTVQSIEKGILFARNNNESELFIIGGGEIYNQSQNYWTDLYITWVDTQLEGEIYFPNVNLKEWELKDEQKFIKDIKNQYNYSFCKYNRKI